MSRQTVAGFAALMLCWSLRGAEVAQITPVDGQAHEGSGVPYFVVTGPEVTSLNALASVENLGQRGLMEFPLNGIPQGAAIESAQIRFDVLRFTTASAEGGGVVYPVLNLVAYPGDGVIEAADAVRSGVLAGWVMVTHTGLYDPIDLDPVYIAGLAANGQWLGVRTEQERLETEAAIYSVEGALMPGVYAPVLSITYSVPEPSPGVVWGVLGAAVLVLRGRHRVVIQDG